MADDPSLHDRRQPPVPALRQPGRLATVRARIGDKHVVEQGEVTSLTDRTVVVELDDPAVALALSLAVEVTIDVDLGGGTRTLLAEPGRRSSDNPTSRRVELVLRPAGDT